MSMNFGSNKSIKEQSYPCPICGSFRSEVVWNKTLREDIGILHSAVIRDDSNKIIQGTIVMCERCGLARTEPKMSENDLAAFYDKEYRDIYGMDNGTQFQSEMNHANNALRILGQHIDIESLNAENGILKFLDIGASTLRLATAMKNSLKNKVEVHAIEPSVIYTDKGIEENEKQKLTNDILIYNSTLNSSILKSDYFDFVTCLNTLEHAHDPRQFLDKIYNIIVDKGILLISVPTLFNISPVMSVDAWLSNAHLYHFVPQTLATLCLVSGFQPLEMIGIQEEVGEKIYLVAQKTGKQDIKIDTEANFALVRQFLLEQDALFMTRYQLLNGMYYKNGGKSVNV